MGFLFGRKKSSNAAERNDNEAEKTELAQKVNAPSGTAVDKSDEEQPSTVEFPPELSASYDHRGETYGPWDVDDPNVPDYDSYLDLGAVYLPYLPGIELRIKAMHTDPSQVLGVTITYGLSSLELEAFASPKFGGVWRELREDLCKAYSDACEVDGVFGTELMLPVTLQGNKTVVTRMVGVEGPRWMLRGVFSGPAATGSGPERDALNKYFADIVVERGDEPLAPRDLIAMHQPLTPGERSKLQEEESNSIDMNLDRPKGPFDSDQQTTVETSLSRGPMFSELR